MTPPDKPTDDTPTPASTWSPFDMFAVENAVWIETVEIRESVNKLTFPEKLEANEVIHCEDTVTWYCDTVSEQVFISRMSSPWEDKSRFDQEDTSKVTCQRVTTIPKQFFDDYVGPYGSEGHRLSDPPVDPEYRLQYDHLYFLVAPEICFVDAVDSGLGVYLIPAEDYASLVGPDVAAFRAGRQMTPYLEAVDAGKNGESRAMSETADESVEGEPV